MKPFRFVRQFSAAILSAFIFMACQNQEEQVLSSAAHEALSGTSTSEVAFPGKTGVEKTGTLFGQPIHYAEIENQAVFEGDILLAPQQLNDQASVNARTTGAATTQSALLWPGGTVYYDFDRNVTSREPISAAITDLQNQTPLRFVLRTNQENYITFKMASGSSSNIGMIGGQQFIYLASPFSKGNVLHEIGHAIGLFHEHTRADRNETIRINLANANPLLRLNFNTYTASGYEGLDYDSMDLGSIMMLDPYAFSADGKPTMTLLSGAIYRIQRQQLSLRDLACIRSLYASLYIINDNQLFAVDSVKGYKTQLPGDWTGTQSLLSKGSFLYIAKGGYLWKINKLNGKPAGLAANFTNVKAMTSYKEHVYAIQNGYLTRFDPTTGDVKLIGGQNWLPAKSMCYLGGFLYILSANTLFRVSPDTGNATFVKGNLKYCTQIGPYQGKLFIVQTTTIFHYDPWTEKENFIATDLKSAETPVTSDGKALFTIRFPAEISLYRIDAYLYSKYLNSNWNNMQFISTNAPAL